MLRSIRSFVRRAGHLTPRQQQGLAQHLPKFQLPKCPGELDLFAYFKRTAATVIEIGFGMGDALLSMAVSHPEINFIGVEVYPAGIGSFAAYAAEHKLTNVGIATEDAVLVLNQQIKDAQLLGIHILFPDPWPKKRHHKRRLIQTDFIHLLAKKLQSNGYLYIVTDWQDYALHISEIIQKQVALTLVKAIPQSISSMIKRPLTKFEKKAHQRGHSISEFLLIKN